MIDILSNKVISKINHKKALVFFTRKKWFKPIYLGKTISFTGHQTIFYIKSEGVLNFHLNFQIEKGDAWLVIVQNGNLYKITNQTENKNFQIRLDAGHARFRLLGEHANIKYQITKLKNHS